ncbi:septum formation initiator family protein [Candidatus Erwinia haradaeae]|uniref:Cell division protein FtsB, partial n=1 Tax=Candidatus Erwinia haradaeae TaxID=1922217 RepID=A0A451DAJ1_9GAMM|nr:septum formation initiator family protein [Candidatus Erwinia haradaeae]VFP83363.1 Cell division protein FtsB [Candidatus Erwinia haradaeae]
MVKLTLLLLVILIWLQYSLWLGKNGLHNLAYIKKDLIFQQKRNSILKIRNEQLYIKLNDLHHQCQNVKEGVLENAQIIPTQKTRYSIMECKPSMQYTMRR